MCIYNEILNTYTKSDDRCAENSIYKSSTKVLPYSFFPAAAMLTSIYIILQYSLCSSSALICQEGFSSFSKSKLQSWKDICNARSVFQTQDRT